MNRKGNSRHNAYLSSLPPFSATNSPVASLHFLFFFFLSSFCWQKLSDSYDCFHTGRWLEREILQLRLKTKLNPKPPPIFSVLIHFFVLLFSPSFKNFFFLLITTDALLVSQFLQTRLSLFPFLSSSSSLSSSHATWPGRLTDSSTHLKTKDDNLLRLSCF